MWQLSLQQRRQQRENGGRVSSMPKTRQRHSSCDSLESAGNRSGGADLWQDEGWWRQLFQETGGMWTCCGLHLPQAIAAGLDQATTFLFVLLLLFLPVWLDGWANLMMPGGSSFTGHFWWCHPVSSALHTETHMVKWNSGDWQQVSLR